MGTTFATGLAKGDDSFQTAKNAAEQALGKMGNTDVALSIVFASSKYDYQQVLKGVREATQGAPLIGCSTAGEFTEDAVENESIACALISSDTHKFYTGTGEGLRADQISAMKKASSSFPVSAENHPFLSAILLVDGLAGKGEESALAALSVLGPNVKFTGGAAGDDLKFEQTQVFYDEQSLTDAVSMCLIASKSPVAISVKHGHTPITQPLTITKAKDNVLYEVDERPAFEVWKELVGEKALETGIDVNKLDNATDIGSFLIRYEAGLLTGNDYKIRVPLSANEDGSLNFACTIVEGSVIRICQSPKEDQIASAKKAAEIAMNAARGTKLAGAIVFDCCCRAIILGEEFYKGRDAIKSVIGDIPMIGLETYGEIAMETGQMSGFHNTTTVIMLIPE